MRRQQSELHTCTSHLFDYDALIADASPSPTCSYPSLDHTAISHSPALHEHLRCFAPPACSTHSHWSLLVSSLRTGLHHSPPPNVTRRFLFLVLHALASAVFE